MAQLIHGPPPGDIAMKQSKRARNVRVAQSRKPSSLSIRQALGIAPHRLHEQQFGKLRQYGFRSWTASGNLLRSVLEGGLNPIRSGAFLERQLQCGRQSGDEWISLNIVASEITADHTRACALAAMPDREKPAIPWWLNQGTRHRRGHIEVAAHEMLVIARQHNHFTRCKRKWFAIFAFYSKAKLPLHHIVIEDQMRGRTKSRRAELRCDARSHTPWGKEFGVQKYPAGQMQNPQNVG